MGHHGEITAIALVPCTCPNCGFKTNMMHAPANREVACSFDCRVAIGEISAKSLTKPRDALPKPRTPEERYARKLAAQRWENNEMNLIRETWI